MVHYFVSPLKGIVITSINFLLSPLTWFLTIFLMVEGINRRKKPMGERQGNPTPDASCETFVLPSLLITPPEEPSRRTSEGIPLTPYLDFSQFPRSPTVSSKGSASQEQVFVPNGTHVESAIT